MAMDLEHLQRLEMEWKSLQPLAAAQNEKLWEKLRLEWNYNSNHIEGNTLTYRETEMYLLRGQTSGVHVEREYVEMKGHDYAIEIVRELARSSEDLTETDIRNLNQVILKESFYKDAITPDGRPARKQIVPGRYKLEPNSVRLANGELFKYADPLEVPARMAKLVEIIRSGASKDGLEFLATLAVTHHEFALIHPFDDGNGRVARLLTNYMLLKKGFPPLVVPSLKKPDYLKALEQADARDPGLLADFFAEQLVWSLQLGIKAASGESIEELSDIEKEIALFVREQKKDEKKQLQSKNAQIVRNFLSTSVTLLFQKFEEKTKQLGELFVSREVNLNPNTPCKIGSSWRETLELVDANQVYHINFALFLKGYRGKATHPFDIMQTIGIRLNEYEYSIETNGQRVYHAIYADVLTEETGDEIMSDFLKKLLQQIKQVAQQ